MGPMASLDGQKISSLPGFDPGPPSPQSVAIPTELPGPPAKTVSNITVKEISFVNQYFRKIFIMYRLAK